MLSLRKITHHEAGHALVMHYKPAAGRTIRVTIDAKRLARYNAGRKVEDAALGLHERRLPIYRPIRGSCVNAEALEAELAYGLGGIAAELRLRNRGPLYFRDLETWPVRFLNGVMGDLDGARGLTGEVLEIREGSARSAMHARVAGGAEREVAAREIVLARWAMSTEMIDAALTEAFEIVSTHWAACHALARALLKRLTLDGDEVREIIEANAPG